MVCCFLGAVIVAVAASKAVGSLDPCTEGPLNLLGLMFVDIDIASVWIWILGLGLSV